LRSEEVLINFSSLSDWHLEAMCRGAQISVTHELYLDLEPSIEVVLTSIRRRFRNMINQGLKIWKHELWIGENCNPSKWDEFRHLHQRVAGRATRSISTWNQQYDSVCKGNSFVIALRSNDQNLIGAALFACTNHEGSYAVGAYDRSLFDKPVSHVAHSLAIHEMKRRGLKWYRIGARPFHQDIPSPTDKEVSIGDFKEGFASHVFPKINLNFSFQDS
jgi:FemAB family protein